MLSLRQKVQLDMMRDKFLNYRDVLNAVYMLFAIAVFIPYFKILPPLGGEVQPNAFLLSLALLFLTPRIKVNIYFWLLLGVLFPATLVLIFGGFGFNHIREFYGYVSFLLLSIISYNYFFYRGEPTYIFYRNVLVAYLLVGIVQMKYDSDFFHFFLARDKGYGGFQGRGVESITSEPTYYGLILLFITILIYSSKYMASNKKYLLYVLVAVSLLIVSKSTTAIFGFVLYVAILNLRLNFKMIVFVFVCSAGVGFFYFMFSSEIEASRVFRVFNIIWNLGIDGLIKYDQSSNDRILHVFFSLKGFVDNYLLPNGYDSWAGYIQRQSVLGYDVGYVSTRLGKIFPFIGSILFELGVFALPMLVYIFGIVYRRFNGREFIAHSLILLYILFQSITVAFTMVPFLIAFFLYQTTMREFYFEKVSFNNWPVTRSDNRLCARK